jgi:hypothetical protein
MGIAFLIIKILLSNNQTQLIIRQNFKLKIVMMNKFILTQE